MNINFAETALQNALNEADMVIECLQDINVLLAKHKHLRAVLKYYLGCLAYHNTLHSFQTGNTLPIIAFLVKVYNAMDHSHNRFKFDEISNDILFIHFRNYVVMTLSNKMMCIFNEDVETRAIFQNLMNRCMQPATEFPNIDDLCDDLCKYFDACKA